MAGRLLPVIKRRGFNYGVKGQNRAWLTVWLLLAGRDALRKRAAKRALVASYTLAPGEGLVISDLGVTRKAAPPLEG